ncbi:GNAT family N-acetyltransferase [Ornithinibacillus sp. BX22]|uniref:GNAT family N-acetyltransferase n=2 Tax=Ornithinibacillus TaxID=484508 RepID=A0A923RJ32_9BACI|nr:MULTISPECIES: GNAT family N-acetyltransferase [Ornithinibacillus]MBC5637641.1 GNAT family N-acetyltransferase [Ornithinibacillus hominis]MBS3681683.1 GNAT family N-acetyltransferase [Ornithinibacillus massiliensis]
MITYRSYQSGDEVQIVHVWNNSLGKDPITPKRFRHLVLLDANFDPNGLRLAFDGETLVGCIYGLRRLLPMIGTELEEENGWITFFFVDPDYEQQGIGSELMKQVEEFFQANNRKSIFFASYAPNYILPGLDEKTYPGGYAFLQKLGFKTLYSPVAMDRSLLDFQLSDDIKQLKREREVEGFTISIAQDKDVYEVIQFANQLFNPDWGRAIREGLKEVVPLERLLIARYHDQLVGFCLYGGYEGIPERFGPFGVDPSMQGKGLGKLLLHECLFQMKAEGLHHAWFLWTGEKSSAGYLYLKTGFNITRQFHVMKKDI